MALGWLLVQPWPRPQLPARSGPGLAAARGWGLQLQNVVALNVPDSVDVLVIDYSRDGSHDKALTRERVAALKARTQGRPRIVLCYLSIGEAESYRYYWQSRWNTAPPAWLGKENTDWKGNFQVRYWMPEWQRVIVAPGPKAFELISELITPAAKPYIDRILEAGFDGVYLDRVDAFQEWQGERGKAAEADMIRLVQRIAGYARTRKPGFLVVAQNGEELLQSDAYRGVLDGVAKEDLLFGVPGEEVANPPEMVESTLDNLNRVKAEGKPVMVVEYLKDGAKRRAAVDAIRRAGFLPLLAGRALDTPPEPIEAGAASGADASPH